MKAFLHFYSSIYNCDIIIKDRLQTKKYFVNLQETEQQNYNVVEIDVQSNDFELTVIPQMVDYKTALADMDVRNWKDKFVKKFCNKLFSIVDETALRVGCVYNISGIEENDVIYVNFQGYVFGTVDKLDLFGLVPMVYIFFEAFYNGALCECSNAFAVNRKEVVSSAKKFVLSNFGLHLLITYPFQVGRVKRLVSDKKIKETLIKFNRMDETQRRKILNKVEKFTSL